MYHYDFRRRELFDMAVSLLVLTVGFSLLLSRSTVFDFKLGRFLAMLPIAFFILLIAFIGHELAHRQVAKRLGYFAHFQADYTFLPLAIIFPLFFGFIFAAPGAVVISPFSRYGVAHEKRDIFYISAAGPAVNIAAAALGLAALGATGWALWYIFSYINAWLALFNLLPIPPLDGSKMIRTNPAMWGVFIAVAAALLWALW
ncbi:MAG: site-2 protease family protein [Pyrobaculum sp.]